MPPAAAVVTVTVKTGSKRPGIRLAGAGVLVSVAARPVDGAANAAVRRALADSLGVAPSAVRLVRGATSRTKAFAVDGLDERSVDRWRATLAVPDS